MAKNVMTPVFRASYPNLFKPKKNELNGKDEYSVLALFKKGEDMSQQIQAAEEALTEEFGEKSKWPAKLKMPFKDQGERAKSVDGKMMLPAGHEAGAVFMTFKSTQRPGVVDQKVQPIIDPSAVYGGCYMRATVRASAYNQAGNRGVTFYLQNVQFVKDGDPISGRPQAETEFAAVEMAVDSSPTASGLFS